MAVVQTENKDHVLWLTIDRPEQRNAINDEVLGLLADGIRLAEASSDIRAVVITGAGDRAFCAGGDLKAAAKGDSVFAGSPSKDNGLVALYREAERCNVPIIGRINGHAMGGGLGLLCMCDLAVGVKKIRIGAPEAKVGLFPMIILSYMLRLIPRRKLMEMSLTGEPWDGVKAHEEGLLNSVCDTHEEMDEALNNLITKIVANSPTAIRMGKKAIHAIQDMDLDNAFEYTQLMIEKISNTADAKEGIAAFTEKRAPRWAGN
ncbi:MAG: enoyl-CoA hydratase-related protein [Motiliproteus sp.]